MKIAILGGTGNLGYGLAKRLANSGNQVVIGSREKQKADQSATEINTELNISNVSGEALADAANEADIVFITVPYKAQQATVEQIKDAVLGKIVVDATVPLVQGNITDQRDEVTSAAEDVVSMLGDSVKFVSGFHTISHTILNQIDAEIESDVFLCGNDDDAVEKVAELTRGIGGNPVHAGGLKNARVLERLTPMIISMNKRYKKKHIGIKATGLLD